MSKSEKRETIKIEEMRKINSEKGKKEWINEKMKEKEKEINDYERKCIED